MSNKKEPPALPLPDIPAFLLFWVLALTVFVQFFTRYVLNDSLSWTEEIARYLLIALTFIGSITVARKAAHIKVIFFYRFLPLPAVRIIVVLVHLVSAVFFGYMGWITFKFIERAGSQLMVSVDISKKLVFWPIAFSFGLMLIYELICAFQMLHKEEAAVREIFEA